MRGEMCIFLAAILLIAVTSDIRFRKIPNWLTYSSMIVGIAYHTWMRGIDGFLFSVGGVVLGVAFLFVIYILGGGGAGDAKLMGAIGGFLGPTGVCRAFFLTAIIGGIYVLIYLALKGYLWQAVKRYGTLLKTFLLTKEFIYIPPPKTEKKPRLAYGLAIALGTIIYVAFNINI